MAKCRSSNLDTDASRDTQATSLESISASVTTIVDLFYVLEDHGLEIKSPPDAQSELEVDSEFEVESGFGFGSGSGSGSGFGFGSGSGFGSLSVPSNRVIPETELVTYGIMRRDNTPISSRRRRRLETARDICSWGPERALNSSQTLRVKHEMFSTMARIPYKYSISTSNT
ncbi:hypothetical protein EKPV-NSW-ORF017 [Eastern grey kangaroopox virus]|uniref:Uncharacterized protein n=1 Tax=Eastern grey kangaroopox virus TaxID=2042482 RepID=A0A2H4QTC1_9POXV|nr:hypothetical protein EKPV-NSW-ORF017 [Eastern grey kangaroopox virus]